MPNERIIPTSRPSDLPTFKILSDETQLSGEYHVMSLVVSKSVNRIPFATILIKDGDPSAEDFLLSNLEFFAPGKSIDIQVGYHNDEESVFKGIVIKHSIKAKNNKSPLLIIECKDECVKMTVGRKNEYFTECTDSDIIEELIGNYGFENSIESIPVMHKEMVQYNCTDWDFVVTRAEANGLLVIPDDGNIQVAPPTIEEEGVLTLTYGATMNDFEAEMDARNQFSSIKSSSWDYSSQELTESESESSSLPEAGNISESELAGVIGLTELEMKHGGFRSENELLQWANSAAVKSKLSRVRGRVNCRGFSHVKPGDTITLAGVGERFNGNVFVAGVRHQISDNTWTTDINFGLSPEWFAKNNDITETPSAGLLAAINGLQVGLVTKIDNDPDGEDRILVRLPIIDNNDEGIWARISTLDAGENRGSFFRPEVDDEVIVGFINDDPRDPIVLGMLNSSVKPAPIVATSDNAEKGFVTRSEMKVLFDDDEISMTLETPNGNKLVLSDADGGVKIEDENGNKIEMNSSGITIESASEISVNSSTDTTIESGANTTISASAQLTAEGSAGAKLSTGAVAIVEGSVVQIN